MARRVDVSIVMGLYNAEPYIRRCMDSLVGQTLADIEIIVVDDGSQDGSPDIVRDYARQDGRIKILVHERNAGQSAAYNTGLRAATGSCLRFVDNDDSLPPEGTGQLFEVYRRIGSEVVRGRVDTINDGRVAPAPWLHAREESFNVPFAENRGIWGGYLAVFGYLFERAFVEKNGFRFREDIYIGQDMVWNAACLTAAEKLSVIDACVYCYDSGSADSLMRPSAPRASHYLSEATAHLAVNRILYEKKKMAFLLYYAKGTTHRYKKIGEAVRHFSEADATSIIAAYREIYLMAPPSTVFSFVRHYGAHDIAGNATLTEFAERLASQSPTEVYKAVAASL